jgi:uncharacterized RDD family membrane protein YckC
MKATNEKPAKEVYVPRDLAKGEIVQIPTVNQNGEKYASIVYRYAAQLVDGLVIGFFLIPLFIVFSVFGYESNEELINIIILPVIYFYFVYLTKTRGATWGKMYFGVKVKSITGGSITWKAAILREIFGKMLSGLILNLGYIWAIFDKRKQGWHDKVAGTIVVQDREISKRRNFLAYFLAFGLIIIAILGILAVVMLVAINPQEQLRKVREQQMLYDNKQFELQQDLNDQYILPSVNPIQEI